MFKKQTEPRSQPAVDHRAEGDRARSDAAWERAADHYGQHLRDHPGDAPIWVQLGHALREQDRPEDAVPAYGEATDRLPDDDDAWLHLAHTAKMLDRREDAEAAFRRHFALTGSKPSYDELLALDAEVRMEPLAVRAGTTYFLVDDLLKFLADHVTVSGIQRVQLGLMGSLLADPPDDIRFITSSNAKRARAVTFWELPGEALRTLVDYAASGTDMERPRLNDMLAELDRQAVRVALGHGTTVFFPGAFWIIERTGLTCAALKSRGVRIGVYVYDLIPLTHPEFCHLTLVEFFARAFTEIVQFADFYLTISAYVADVLREFFVRYDLPDAPITPLPLAHFLTISSTDEPPSPRFLQTMRSTIKGRPYALYVSTLEGRKNHLYVVNIWQELLRRGIDMPDLVFLGRKGWRSEGLFDFLDGTNRLNGRVHLLHDVSDGDLAHLYRTCEFTLFTSFVEGWGLPVGESLVFGKPCVASGTCSIPEVGGALVDYVDPFNMRDGEAAIRRMATDDAYRHERAEEIRTSFQPRSWADVTRTLLGILREMNALPLRAGAEAFRLPASEMVDLRWRMLDLADLDNLLTFPPRALIGDDFYDQEVFGVWMRGRAATIDLPTVFEEGTEATALLNVVGAPWCRGVRYTVGVGEEPGDLGDAILHELPPETAITTVAARTGRVGPGGRLRIRLEAFPETEHVETDGREFYLGLRALAYHNERAAAGTRHPLAQFVDVQRFDPTASPLR